MPVDYLLKLDFFVNYLGQISCDSSIRCDFMYVPECFITAPLSALLTKTNSSYIDLEIFC